MVRKAAPSEGSTINTRCQCFFQLIEVVSIDIASCSEYVTEWWDRWLWFRKDSDVDWARDRLLKLKD